MNVNRGLLRAWIVCSLIWCAGWLAFVWTTCDRFTGALELGVYCYTTLSRTMSLLQFFGLKEYAEIGATALAPPIAALIIGAGIVWAAKGFSGR